MQPGVQGSSHALRPDRHGARPRSLAHRTMHSHSPLAPFCTAAHRSVAHPLVRRPSNCWWLVGAACNFATRSACCAQPPTATAARVPPMRRGRHCANHRRRRPSRRNVGAPARVRPPRRLILLFDAPGAAPACLRMTSLGRPIVGHPLLVSPENWPSPFVNRPRCLRPPDRSTMCPLLCSSSRTRPS